MDYILSADIGSSSVKTALFDPEGQMLGLSIQEYELLIPAPGIAEIEPETFWSKLKQGIETIRIRYQMGSIPFLLEVKQLRE